MSAIMPANTTIEGICNIKTFRNVLAIIGWIVVLAVFSVAMLGGGGLVDPTANLLLNAGCSFLFGIPFFLTGIIVYSKFRNTQISISDNEITGYTGGNTVSIPVDSVTGVQFVGFNGIKILAGRRSYVFRFINNRDKISDAIREIASSVVFTRQEHTFAWVVAYIVFAVVYIITLLFSLAASFDTKLIDEVNLERSSFFAEGETCCIDGCSNEADVSYSYQISSKSKRHKNLTFANTINYQVYSSSSYAYVYDKQTHKDEYILITPQENGDYHASLEEEWYTTTTKQQDGVKYWTALRGYYCSEHGEDAATIMEQEIKDSISGTFFYIWFKTLFPMNLIVLTLLLFGLRGYMYDTRDAAVSLASVFLTGFGTIVGLILAVIGNAADVDFLSVFGNVIMLILAFRLGYSAGGFLSAYPKSKYSEST